MEAEPDAAFVSPLDAETHQPAPVVQAPVDHEKFSGFCITDRCFTAAQVEKQFQGSQVLRFSKLAELRKRADCNRIVIGLLYSASTTRLGNGELVMKWCFTDLAEPQPGHLTVHLRGRAYEHWKKPAAAKVSSRQSIFAIMNPREPVMENDEWTVRVESPGQLAKLGTCPSLGLCDMKGCQLPCNLDLKDRFCKMHLGLAYANKGGRILTGGNSLANLLNVGPRRRPRVQAQIDEDDEEVNVERAETAKRVKTEVAMKLDERRFMTFETNDNYVNSIRAGSKVEQQDTSRVPVLGRAFREDSSLEIDFATLETTAKGKADRVIERMVEKRAERRMVDEDVTQEQAELGFAIAPRQSPAKASSSKTKDPPKAPKKSLAELMEALQGKKTARRAGIESAKTYPKQSSSTISSRSPELAPDDVPHEQHLITINKLFDALVAARDDMARIKEALDAADKLPISILEGPEGGKFYAAVGSLTMHASRSDIRRQALLARRRWRSASFDAKQSAEMQSEKQASASEVAHEAAPEPLNDVPATHESQDILHPEVASSSSTGGEGAEPLQGGVPTGAELPLEPQALPGKESAADMQCSASLGA